MTTNRVRAPLVRRDTQPQALRFVETMMPTPLALLVHDIVEEIVDRAAVVGSRKDSRRLLAHLTRLSAIFHDPAVRQLWAEMDDLDPLFKILTSCKPIPGSRSFVGLDDDDDEAVADRHLRRNGTIEEQIAAASRFRLVRGNALPSSSEGGIVLTDLSH